MPTDNRTKSSKSHQDAPRCSVLWSFNSFFSKSESVGIASVRSKQRWNASNTYSLYIASYSSPIQTVWSQNDSHNLTILKLLMLGSILLFPACAQCPVRGKCALFCRDGSVAHGTRHFAKTSEITICDAHWRHNMSPNVTRNEELCTESGTVHTSLDGRTVRMRLFSSLYKAIHFISIDLNGLCPDVPSVQKRRLFWRADWHPASAEKNRQNLPGTRNSYDWVSRTQSTQERNISKLDWSRIKILLRQY